MNSQDTLIDHHQSSSATSAPSTVSDSHGHDPNVAHHFASAEQQFNSGKLGMWTFLATEVLMFGGLFCGYAVWRRNDPLSFEFGHQLLETKWGAINTVVLITSSLTMAWAVRAAQLGQQQALKVLLVLTLLGAGGFMGIKYMEYSAKFAHGTGPGMWFDTEKIRHYFDSPAPGHAPGNAPGRGYGDGQPAEPAAPTADATAASGPTVAESRSSLPDPGDGPKGLTPSDDPPAEHAAAGGHGLTAEQVILSRNFVDVYFLMTGLHGIHVLVGMGLISWLLVRAMGGTFGPRKFAAVDNVGLYWHLVDLIWIFLFPLLYLID